MSTGTTKSPALPIAPVEYSRAYQDQLNNVLRLYFAQLDTPGVSAGSAQRTGNTVIAALNFSATDPTTGNTVVSFAAVLDYTLLTSGSHSIELFIRNPDGSITSAGAPS